MKKKKLRRKIDCLKKENRKLKCMYEKLLYANPLESGIMRINYEHNKHIESLYKKAIKS